jgi:hypothetical protein
MDNRRFSLAEFKALFPGRCESEDQWLREYRSFQAVFEHLDSMTVPDLSRAQKAEIFRRSWQKGRQGWLQSWPALFRQPVVAFAAGIVLGCTLMLAIVGGRARSPQPLSPDQGMRVVPPAAAERMLTVEHLRYTRVYQGKVVERLYPQIENPKIVVEKAQESSTPQRVLYGTLDDGEVYVVWNL